MLCMCVCLSVYLHTTCVRKSSGSRIAVWCPGTGVAEGHESPCECREVHQTVLSLAGGRRREWNIIWLRVAMWNTMWKASPPPHNTSTNLTTKVNIIEHGFLPGSNWRIVVTIFIRMVVSQETLKLVNWAKLMIWFIQVRNDRVQCH